MTNFKSESDLQEFCFAYLKAHNIFAFAVPNGEMRDGRTAARLKKQGVVAGVSDMIVWFRKAVVYVEFKTKRGKLSGAQEIFQWECQKRAFPYHIVRSLDDMKELIYYYHG